MIYLIFALVIVICYWALRQPERAFVRGWRRRALWLIVGGYAGIVLLTLGGERHFFALLFVAYPLLYSVLLRERLRRALGRLRESRAGQLLIVFPLLWFSELFPALDIAEREPVGWHMLVYFGFYIGLALVVVLALRRWRFGFAELFTVGGLWGLVIEQQFLGPRMLSTGDVIGFLAFASLTFSVYGLFVGGPWLLFYEEWSQAPRAGRWRHVLLFMLLAVVPLLTWALWSLLLQALGINTDVLVA